MCFPCCSNLQVSSARKTPIKTLLRVVQGNCLHEPEWAQQIVAVPAVLQVLDAAARRWKGGFWCFVSGFGPLEGVSVYGCVGLNGKVQGSCAVVV